MSFAYFDAGVLQPKPTEWAVFLVGPSSQWVESVEREEPNVLYLNTAQGLTLCVRFTGPSYSPETWATKKFATTPERLASNLQRWTSAFDQDPVTVIQQMEAQELVDQWHVTAKDKVEVGLGTLVGTQRAFEAYLETQKRRARGQWLPQELPLCPQCLAHNIGHCSENRHWCRRHRWWDPTRYEGLLEYPTGGLQGPRPIGYTPPTPFVSHSKQIKAVSTAQESLTPGLVLNNTRPDPETLTDPDQIQALGNRLIEQHTVAQHLYTHPQFLQQSLPTRQWAKQCLEELEVYLTALRTRYHTVKGSPVVTPLLFATPTRPLPDPEEGTGMSQNLEELRAHMESINRQWLTIDRMFDTPERAQALREQMPDLCRSFDQRCCQLLSEATQIWETLSHHRRTEGLDFLLPSPQKETDRG